MDGEGRDVGQLAIPYAVLGSDGEKYPADLATARRWVIEGRITSGTLVYCYKDEQWRTAAEIPEISTPQPPVNRTGGGFFGYLLAVTFVAAGLLALVFVIWATWCEVF